MIAEQRTVLVTGSSGLIGSAVVRRIAGAYRVVGFDIDGGHAGPEGAASLRVDVGSDESVSAGLRRAREIGGGRIASVVHLVAYTGLGGEPSEEYERVTLGGTRRLIAGLAGFEVEQIIYVSTILVHAPCRPDQRIDEDWPLDPKWAYPRSKLEAERLVLAGRGAAPAVILRVAGVYDDHCRSASLSHQMVRIYEDRPTARVYPGDLSHGRARVHVDDVADAIARAVERRSELSPETTLLIGEPETVSYGELQRLFWWLIRGEERETVEVSKFRARAKAWLCHLTGSEKLVSPWILDFVDDNYTLDTSKAERELGWAAVHRVRDVLPRMAAFLREHPVQFFTENRLTPPAWLWEAAGPGLTGPML